MYKILNEKYADAEDGAFSFIEYQYNKDAKPEKWKPLLPNTILKI